MQLLGKPHRLLDKVNVKFNGVTDVPPGLCESKMSFLLKVLTLSIGMA